MILEALLRYQCPTSHICLCKWRSGAPRQLQQQPCAALLGNPGDTEAMRAKLISWVAEQQLLCFWFNPFHTILAF